MITSASLAADLQKLGLSSGDMLVVHSSMKKIGTQVEGGPHAVIEALLQVIGETGTLLMPVFCKKPEGLVDLRTEPSRLGLITETFRTWPGVLRSNDATHSIAAIGPLAEQVLAGHEVVSPLDANSPLHTMCRLGGKVLHIGTDLCSCSLLHVAESIVNVPYQHIGYAGFNCAVPYIGTDGVERMQEPHKSPGDSRGFLCVMELDAVKNSYRSGLVGHAPTLLFDGQVLLDATVALLEKEPCALLCDKGNCDVCVDRRAVMANL